MFAARNVIDARAQDCVANEGVYYQSWKHLLSAQRAPRAECFLSVTAIWSSPLPPPPHARSAFGLYSKRQGKEQEAGEDVVKTVMICIRYQIRTMKWRKMSWVDMGKKRKGYRVVVYLGIDNIKMDF
jgi:hypothetical protein